MRCVSCKKEIGFFEYIKGLGECKKCSKLNDKKAEWKCGTSHRK